MATPDSPQTLGWWMNDRRGELDMTWDEVAAAADLPVGTLLAHAAGTGRRMRPQTKHKIQRGLRWAPGSIDRIHADGDPVRLEDIEPAPEPEMPRYPKDPERQEIWDALRGVPDRRAAIMVEDVMKARYPNRPKRETGT